MAIEPSSFDHLNHSVLVRNKKEHKNDVAETTQSDEQELFELLQSEETPAAEQWKYLQSTDEMSAVLTQFNSRKMFDKKKIDSDGVFSSFEAILEDDVMGKVEKIEKSFSGSDMSLDYRMRFVKGMFPDISDLILVLSEILKKDTLDKIAKKKVKELLDEAIKTSDKKILKSGINCALKAKLFGKSFSLDPRMLRVAYRDFLLEEMSEIDLYVGLISNFGFEKRQYVVDFIEASLLCDICSLDPSCSRTEFGFYLGKMHSLTNIRSVEQVFVEGMLNDNVVKELLKDEKKWVYFILNILKHPDSVDSIMAEVIGEKSLNLKRNDNLRLINAIYRHITKIPALLFGEESGYERIMDYLRSAAGKMHRR